MYTAKERQALEKALEKLQKCGGDCKHCAKCHIYTARDPHALIFATGCDLLPVDLFGAIANYPSDLHREAVATVEFELS